MLSARLIFWVSASLVFYVYAGYPLLLWILQHVFRRPVRKRPIEPSLSLLVPAYNEARVIAAKIRNVLAIDYPADKLEIVIACDGSSDGTPEEARRAVEELGAAGRVRILDFPVNRGKLAVLNEVVPSLRGNIVVFSDAASMIAPGALRAIAANFADPAVGAVSGIYGVAKHEESTIGKQEDFYWRYETFLKQQEARLGSILGAHGSLYAIRKALYPFPHAGLINDDYIIPVRILQRGHRVAYEPEAVAWEEAREMDGFSRRVRIMAGNIEQSRELAGFLWPPRPVPLCMFLSHKIGRLFVPPAMLALMASNLLLLGSPFYLAAALLQGGFYFLAGAGALFPLQSRILRLPYYFCMINAAVLPALGRVLHGRSRIAWK